MALGSNRRHPRWGAPRAVLTAAVARIEGSAGKVLAVAPFMDSAPVGPSRRRFANTALLLRTSREPPDLLRELKAVEVDFGRRRGGQAWAARVLDCDIILWSGGCVASPSLVVPHPLFRQREFVLRPAAAIAPDQRDPVTGLTVRQLHARLTSNRPLPR